MQGKNKDSKKKQNFILNRIILPGVFLLVLVLYLSGNVEIMSTTRLARNTIATMKQQCISFDKLKTTDRTKSLFRLTELLLEFRNRLEIDPSLVNDAALESCVDHMRMSGIALLDDKLQLEASGYTRRFCGVQDKEILDEKNFQDILDYPSKIYAERVILDGEYYDVCMLARTDAPGVLVGFYKQPAGVISSTESDLESLLTGLRLERNGQYAIVKEGHVCTASNPELLDKHISDSAVLTMLSEIPSDDSLHMIYAEGAYYWGYRAACQGYVLYVYYPIFAFFSVWLISAAIFLAVYAALCFFYFSVRNHALYENQQELRESNRHLTETVKMLQALETIYFALFYADLEQDRYETIYIAPWLEGKVPWAGSYTEVMHDSIRAMVMEDYRAEISERMSREFIRETLCKEKITDARKSFYTDYQTIRDGAVIWCRMSVAIVDYDDEGNPRHMLALLQDVNTEKTREAAYQERILKEAQDAKIANKAKTEFLRRISHDIRTPINGIQGYIAMASRYPTNLELQLHCRERVITVMQMLMDLVNSVLDMSRLESGEIVPEEKPFELNRLLDEVNTILQPQAAAKNIRYQITWQGGMPQTRLVGSPQHLLQIFVNLLGNAVKYGKVGGYIQLSICQLSCTKQEAVYQFIIADNGIGMSKKFQARMFEPFAQEAVNARTTYQGTGLGLAIVKKLVDLMGGTIEVRSHKGLGTTFLLTLRFGIDRNGSSAEEAEPQEEVVLPEGLHALLVEDNSINMEVAEFLLRERGMAVTTAHNGSEAVELFAASPVGFYDIIFMDIMMPVMNGLEAARVIRAMERPDAKAVPILAMSANAFSEDVQMSLDAGMNAHISKPMDEKKLLSITAGLLEGREKEERETEGEKEMTAQQQWHFDPKKPREGNKDEE